MRYSLWYNAPTMLPAFGRQHRGSIIPQDARCLKFKPRERAFKQFKSPVLNVLTYCNDEKLKFLKGKFTFNKI